MYSPTLAFRLCFILLAMLLSAVSVAENTGRQLSLAKLEELNKVSAKLVQEARSSKAKATPFRIDARLYRESLRTLMLNNQKINNPQGRIPRTFLLNMVRMSALLSSAAECRTGRYIVCPAELMTKLKAQQQLLSKDLDSFKAMLNGTG